jgi:ABC-type glycerol-3-phosphate transport system substrate-binding protein
MDRRLSSLAEELAASLIGRREFLRRAAVITGSTAAALHVLGRMAGAQARTRLRVWLFKSFVTGSNDVLARQIDTWAKDRKVDVEVDWATFGDREPKFVAAIEAGNPPDLAEMNIFGPLRYKPVLRDVSKLAADLARTKGGLLPFAEQATKVDGKFLGVPRYAMISVFYIRRDVMEAKGLKPPRVYDPDVVDFARKAQDPSKDLWGFGQTLNRSDDGDGFMQNLLWSYGGGSWDKEGKPALNTAFRDANLKALRFAVDTIQKHKIQPPGVMGWTDVSNNEAYMASKLVTTNNGASLYYTWSRD